MTTHAAFDRPVFIMAPPRSGTTLFFDLLAKAPGLWTVGGESHDIVESIDKLHPRQRGWESNRLTAADADPETVGLLMAGFRARLRDRDGRRPAPGARPRLLEKTPRHSLRLSFFAAAFPDARFIYLFREPKETVSSMLDAWRSRRFVSYEELPEWSGPPWSMLLVPGWRQLSGKELEEIVARQWEAATTCLLNDLEALPREHWCAISYARLIAEPQSEMVRLCDWIGVEWDRTVTAPLPRSHSALTPPHPEKWRRNEKELTRVMPLIEITAQRAKKTMEGNWWS